MQNRSKFGFLAVVAVSFQLFCGNALAEERNLLELYALAKAKDAGIGRAEAKLQVGYADKDIAWSMLLPRIDSGATLRQFWNTTKDYGASTIQGEYTGYSYNISGRLPLLAVPSYFQIAAANAGIQSAQAGTSLANQNLIIKLLDGYLKFLKSQADERLYREELARVGKILEQTQAFLKAGTGDIIAVFEAKARMDSAAADLIKVEGQRQIAEQELAALTGIPVSAVKDLIITTPLGPDPVELAWWVETMNKKNPVILQAQEDLNQAEEQRKASRAAHLPSIQTTGGYTTDKGSTFLPKVETAQWYAGISISLPIYSGGETSARVRRALAAESERIFMLDDAKEQGTKRLKDAYLMLQYNQTLVKAYQQKRESAELQLKATRKGREIGTRTAVDLLNAEHAYAISHRDLTSVLYDNIQRRLELKAAAGILSEDDLTSLHQGSNPDKI